MARIKKLSSMLVAALALGAAFAATGSATPDVPARAASVPQAVAASNPQKCASSRKTTTRMVYGPKYYTARSGFAAGQPAGGYRFQYGGSVQFQQSSGGNASFNFSLGAPWGQVGFSLPLGKVSSSYTGYSVNIPKSSSAFYKVYASKTYHVRGYELFVCSPGLWNNGKEWVTRGTEGPVLYSISATAKKV
jgi:hypothetical protein